MNTLKRLSWNSNDPSQPHYTPSGSRSPSFATHAPPSHQQPPSPGYPFPTVPPPSSRAQVERQTLHRSLQTLGQLLLELDRYRDLAAAVAKSQKSVAKAQREVASCFGDKVEPGARNSVIASALLASAAMFESLAEVDGKHAKLVKKEYEALNDLAGKWFGRTSKEEKVFDESLAQLDQKVQRATANYEKTRPRARPSMADAQSAAANHDRYIQSLSSLSTAISTLKGNYAETAGEKREKVVKEVGRALCGLAEGGWRNRVEGTRKGGEKAGLVVECGVFCESGMSIGPGVGQEQEQPISPVHPQQQAQADRPSATTNQGALRGPRPQPGSEQSSYFDQPPSQPSLDSSLFAPSPHHPPNTYTVQLDALRPPTPSQPSPSSTHSRTREAPPQQHHSRPGSVARLGSTDSLASRHPVQQAQYTSDAPRTRSPLDMAGGGGEEMEPSRSSGTMYALSSTSSSDARGGIVAPRGFVLDDEPLSPTSRRTVDHGSTSTEEQVADPAELRRPTPRYGGPSPASTPQKETVTGTGVERTDTSASERNFVARMREKYAEEKERKQEEQEAERNRVGGGAQERAASAFIARSSSRVSNLAKRYSSPPTSESYSTLPNARPTPSHHHSHTMQPLTGGRGYDPSAASYDEFGAAPSSNEQPRSPGSPPTQPRSTSSSSNPYGSPNSSRPLPTPQARSYTRQPLPPSSPSAAEQPHSSVCACEQCTLVKYGSTKAGSGTSKEEEGRLQREFRGESAGRRISLPGVFGRK